MRKPRFSEERILAILQDIEAGERVIDTCRKYGSSDVTFYKWREKYSGPQSVEARQLKRLEEENAQLKQLLAEAVLAIRTLMDALAKKKERQRPKALAPQGKNHCAIRRGRRGADIHSRVEHVSQAVARTLNNSREAS
jgi:putative transposase